MPFVGMRFTNRRPPTRNTFCIPKLHPPGYSALWPSYCSQRWSNYAGWKWLVLEAKSKQAFTFDFDEQSGHSRLSVGEIPQATDVVMQSIDRRA
jgi:hypothetical protein